MTSESKPSFIQLIKHKDPLSDKLIPLLDIGEQILVKFIESLTQDEIEYYYELKDYDKRLEIDGSQIDEEWWNAIKFNLANFHRNKFDRIPEGIDEGDIMEDFEYCVTEGNNDEYKPPRGFGEIKSMWKEKLEEYIIWNRQASVIDRIEEMLELFINNSAIKCYIYNQKYHTYHEYDKNTSFQLYTSGFHLAVNSFGGGTGEYVFTKGDDKLGNPSSQDLLSVWVTKGSLDKIDLNLGEIVKEVKDWRALGGTNRHKDTNIIKRKVIKPLFLNREIIKGTSTSQRARKIYDMLDGYCNLLHSIGHDIKEKQGILEKSNIPNSRKNEIRMEIEQLKSQISPEFNRVCTSMVKKLNIDYDTAVLLTEYLLKGDKSSSIYDWCLEVEDGTL